MKKDSQQILLRLSVDLVNEIERVADEIGVKRNDALVAAVIECLKTTNCEESFRLKDVVANVRQRRIDIERTEEQHA